VDHGDPLRVIQTGQPLLVALPDLRPPACRAAVCGGRYAQPQAALPPEQWPAVVEHAGRHGLRATGRAFGVSHEAVRQIVVRSRCRAGY
jgi:hypothetical protein